MSNTLSTLGYSLAERRENKTHIKLLKIENHGLRAKVAGEDKLMSVLCGSKRRLDKLFATLSPETIAKYDSKDEEK